MMLLAIIIVFDGSRLREVHMTSDLASTQVNNSRRDALILTNQANSWSKVNEHSETAARSIVHCSHCYIHPAGLLSSRPDSLYKTTQQTNKKNSSLTKDNTLAMAIRFTNCKLAIDGAVVKQDLTISASTGKILAIGVAANDGSTEQVIDLGGRLLTPGMIDIQLNGALGYDFSTVPENESKMDEYETAYRAVCRGWIKTGVTSFLPTVVTNPSVAYKRVCDFLSTDMMDLYLSWD